MVNEPEMLRAARACPATGEVDVVVIGSSAHSLIGSRPHHFVLHHHATTADGERSMTWSVLPDSGTDGLRSIRGEGQIIAGPDGHTFTLDYQL